MFQEGLVLYQEFGTKSALAWVNNLMAVLLCSMGDYAAAGQHNKTGLDLYQQAEDPRGQAWSLDNSGDLALAAGDLDKARGFYEESLSLQVREKVHPLNKAWYFFHVGNLNQVGGQKNEAQSYLEKALKSFRKTHNLVGIVMTLNSLGEATLDKGLVAKSKTCFKEAIQKSLANKRLIFLVDAMFGVARLLKASGDERNALVYLTLASNHPACRMMNRERTASLMMDLESRFPPEEVEGILHWTKTASIEDVAAAWADTRPPKPLRWKAKKKSGKGAKGKSSKGHRKR